MNAKCAKCDSVAEYDIYTKVVKCSFCGFEATYDEYIGLMDHFNFTPEDIQQFILNALESSWRPGTDSEKSLAKQFQAHPNWTPPGLD